MAKDLLSYDAILRDALLHFDNACVAAKTVNRQFLKEAQNAKRGDSFYVPIPETPTVSDGPTLDLKDIAPEKVLVALDKQKHCDFVMTSAERTHSEFQKFSEMVIKPRMEALANQMDVDLLALTKSVSMSVGTAGTGPTSIAVPMQAGQRLTEHGVPQGDRFLVMSPLGKYRLLGTATTGTVNLANPGIPAGQAYKDAAFGMVAGMTGYESPNMYTHTVGADVTMANYSSGAAEAMTTMEASATGTLAVGDVFTVAGVYDVNPITKQTLSNLKQFVVRTATSADATIDFYPAMYSSASGALQNVSALPTGSAAITFVGTASTAYTQDIAYHRDAFGLVTADLVMPEGVDMGARRTDKGISARIVRDYDIVNDRFPCRIDILYGVVAFRPHTHAVRITN